MQDQPVDEIKRGKNETKANPPVQRGRTQNPSLTRENSETNSETPW